MSKPVASSGSDWPREAVGQRAASAALAVVLATLSTACAIGPGLGGEPPVAATPPEAECRAERYDFAGESTLPTSAWWGDHGDSFQIRTGRQ